MDYIEDYSHNEALRQDTKTMVRIAAIAFSYNWDAEEIIRRIHHALEEGRDIRHDISSILDECEKNDMTQGDKSDSRVNVITPYLNTDVENSSNHFDEVHSDNFRSDVFSNNLSNIEISDSVPNVDINDTVTTVRESNYVTHMEVNDNVPVVEITNSASNVGVSNSGINMDASDSVSNAATLSHESNLKVQVRALQNENRLLVQQIMCLQCSGAERDSLLLPCGHFILCTACSDKCSFCPLCNVKILATSRTRL